MPENKKMEKEVLVNWDEALDGGNYVKLVKDERVKMAITNCRVVKKMAKFKDDAEEKEVMEFRADVVNLDGEALDKVKQFNMTSKRFMGAMKDKGMKIDGGPTVYSFSIKRIGDGTSTTYDVEDFREIPQE
jgi:hypothetical protein